MAIIALLVAMVVGGLAGLVTGLLNTKLKIAPILAGILTMTGLYSINMFIMGIGSGPRPQKCFVLYPNIIYLIYPIPTVEL